MSTESDWVERTGGYEHTDELGRVIRVRVSRFHGVLVTVIGGSSSASAYLGDPSDLLGRLAAMRAQVSPPLITFGWNDEVAEVLCRRHHPVRWLGRYAAASPCRYCRDTADALAPLLARREAEARAAGRVVTMGDSRKDGFHNGADIRTNAERDRDALLDQVEALVEEVRLLRELWDFVWNKLGITDGGDHAELSLADDQRLSDLAQAVEDYDIRAALAARSEQEAKPGEGGVQP